MNGPEIFQILIGLGIMASLWRLTYKVGAISAAFEAHTQHTEAMLEDHEERLRQGNL